MKISSLDAKATHWRDQAKNAEKEGETRRRDILNNFGDYCEISADKMRSEINEPPQHMLTKEIIEREVENNPETKLERFKRWLKENGVALGGVTIMIGTLITAIVSLAKSGATAVKGAVNSTTDFLKKFARLAKKLGPVVGSISMAFQSTTCGYSFFSSLTLLTSTLVKIQEKKIGKVLPFSSQHVRKKL